MRLFKPPSPCFSRGFSLIELSIALSIIGLMVGGALIGQSLMRAAEIRSVAEDYVRYVAAVGTFKDKYMALPGDMPDATKIWGAVHATPATCKVTPSTDEKTCDGDGDGKLEDALEVGGPPGSTEIYRFWQHLANAGLIEGIYTGVSGPGYVYHDSIIGVNTPFSKIPRAGFSLVRIGSVPTGTPGRFEGKYGHTVTFGIKSIGGGLTDVDEFLPEEASSIDFKLDDGKPGTGSVRTYNTLWSDCPTSDDPVTAKYDITTTDSACGLLFPNAF